MIEAMKRVEDAGCKAAGALGLLARDFSGDAEDQQPGTGGHERVVLDRKACGDDGGGGAAHRSDTRHQRIAVKDGRATQAIGDHIRCTG